MKKVNGQGIINLVREIGNFGKSQGILESEVVIFFHIDNDNSVDQDS